MSIWNNLFKKILFIIQQKRGKTALQPESSKEVMTYAPSETSKEVITYTQPETQKGNATAFPIIVDDVVINDLKKKYISFDVETTGFNSMNDRIIEVGAVIFENGEIVNKFSSLINPCVEIPSSATSVNHITNDMIKSAPLEKNVYPQLVKFLGNALKEETLICAHNARFDMNFLSHTLSRLGYDADIYYVDTLKLSRSLIKGLENYKQNTVALHFGIENKQAHRAISDAEVCGKILWELISLKEKEYQEQQERLKKVSPTDEELEVCAYIQHCIMKKGIDTDWLSFYKNSSNHVEIKYLYNVLKFKLSKYGNYIIVEEEAVKNINLNTKPCTKSEGGIGDIRVYFKTPFELEPLSNYFVAEYKKHRNSALSFLKRKSQKYINELRANSPFINGLNDDELQKLLLSAKNRSEALNSHSEEQQENIKPKEKNSKKKETSTKNIDENFKKSSKKPVLQLTTDMSVITRYESIAEAVRQTGINSKSIRETAKGTQKHAGGFIWKYADDAEKEEYNLL